MAYQGHKNWNHWNVSLWLSNDEATYRMLTSVARGGDALFVAARDLKAMLPEKTPDGAPYSLSALTEAIRAERFEYRLWLKRQVAK